MPKSEQHDRKEIYKKLIALMEGNGNIDPDERNRIHTLAFIGLYEMVEDLPDRTKDLENASIVLWIKNHRVWSGLLGLGLFFSYVFHAQISGFLLDNFNFILRLFGV